MQSAPTLPRTAAADLHAARTRAGGPCRAVVARALPADLHTPVGVYLRLRGLSDHNFLLESVEGGETLARHSFVGGRPRILLRAWGHRVEVEEAGRIETTEEDPRGTLRRLCSALPLVADPGLPPFLGGAVGFFSYDSVRLAEAIPRGNPDPLGTPDLDLGLYEELVAFDHVASLLYLLEVVELRDDVDAAWDDAVARLDELEALIFAPLTDIPRGGQGRAPEFTSDLEQPAYEAAVRTAQEHILAGDIFQGVLSRRLSAELSCDPFAVYRALRILNPSPYLFFFELGEHTLVGASPEMLVKVQGRSVETLPIAGTRPRGTTEAEDRALEAELRADPKERAEHEMLVDLGRNDLGRVSAFGSVEVCQHMAVHRFSHVMHLVSRVRGRLREGCDALDALYACFPAGTVSGAPKVRAMQIIEELEPAARGVYAGAVGYLDFGGDLDTCIAIRTAIVHRGRIHIQAGAGVVYDSVPTAEFEETKSKARALIEAVRWAEGGALR